MKSSNQELSKLSKLAKTDNTTGSPQFKSASIYLDGIDSLQKLKVAKKFLYDPSNFRHLTQAEKRKIAKEIV